MRLVRALAASLLALAGLGTARAAHAEIETYQLHMYPATTAGCAAEAAALGRRIAQTTGVAIFRTACDMDWGDAYSLIVNYVADQQLSEITIADPGARNDAAYATDQECLADLPAQVAAFRRATRLEPHSAYCYRGELEIRAFGQPAALPLFYNERIYGYPVGDTLQFEATVRANAAAEGLDVFKATLNHDLFESYLSLGYYSTSIAPLETHQELVFGTEDLCLRHIPYVESVLRNGGERVLGSLCARLELSDAARLYAIVSEREGAVRIEHARLEYATYAECFADRERVLDVYRGSSPTEVLGGVCSTEELARGYDVLVFLRVLPGR
jgi:hypothetical protein